jgi:NAD(P)-dependent dehydrogenase (short-subunit alcohol dehydrogenase family)
MASLNGQLSFKSLASLSHTTNKAAILGMTRQLAMEGSEHGIRVNSISPGLIQSGANRAHLQNGESGFAREMIDRTLLGRAMRAVATDREAARLMGIDVRRVVMLSFALSAAVGAIGGLIVTPVTLTIYDAGTMLGLKGFAAAVTGGLGNTFGGIAGGLVLGLLETFGGGLIGSEFKDVAAFLLLLLLLFLRPRGLFARGQSERV